MSEFVSALMQHEFLRNALAAGVLASIGCGLTGPYVVVRRIGYLAGGIAHSVLGGMGIAYYLGASPVLGALAAAVVAALIIGWVSLKARSHEDMLIGAMWAGGMAVGVLFISRTGGYNVDLLGYLFGNILLVAPRELTLMLALDALLLALVLTFHRQFLAVCFDEEFARTRGVRVAVFHLLLLVMIAITVVLLIQVVGLILVIALITLPAAVGRDWAGSLSSMMIIAAVVGIAGTGGGLAVSYSPDLPAGATIVLVTVGIYFVSLALRGLHREGLQG